MADDQFVDLGPRRAPLSAGILATTVDQRRAQGPQQVVAPLRTKAALTTFATRRARIRLRPREEHGAVRQHDVDRPAAEFSATKRVPLPTPPWDLCTSRSQCEQSRQSPGHRRPSVARW